MKQITLLDDHLEWIIERLRKDHAFGMMDRDAEFLKTHAIDVSNYQADISTRLIQAGYDKQLLRDRINDLEREISAKNTEISKLKYDKTTALKEFVEELRKQPLNVVLVDENEVNEEHK
jgi:cell division protein FtsB